MVVHIQRVIALNRWCPYSSQDRMTPINNKRKGEGGVLCVCHKDSFVNHTQDISEPVHCRSLYRSMRRLIGLFTGEEGRGKYLVYYFLNYLQNVHEAKRIKPYFRQCALKI